LTPRTSRTAISRRDFLAAALGSSAALAACRKKPDARTFGGRLVGPSVGLGHKLREGFRPAPAAPKRIGVVIVGGGVSGLSAAWRLTRADMNDFLVLEIEDRVGGTSLYEKTPDTAYPWGAHYVPVPSADNRSLVTLLKEVGAVTGLDDTGALVCAEEVLCRAPQERLFYKGLWYEGLYLRAGATADDLRQLGEFNRAMDDLAKTRDARGRPAFCVPLARSSDDPDLTALDRISMAEYLDQRGWTSPRLRWLVDYACRDDFGLALEETSAWAGAFYFAARIEKPGGQAAELLTWPEGNGHLVRHLEEACGPRVRPGAMVTEVRPGPDGVEVHLFDTRTRKAEAYLADRVVFALPRFLARPLLAPYRDAPPAHLAEFRYGSWVVANVALKDRPASRGYPDAWDNVLYESRSLGYVIATHQAGKDDGPTVWTWYLPLCGDDPRASRELLLSADWGHWVDALLADVSRAHPDFVSNITSVDVWRWGHAMVRPEVGFLFGGARRKAQEPLGRVHFAHTDLSGVALFEEAHYHGVRAAEEILSARGVPFESLL
jgi:protoporphyrinogen oxidase